MYNENDKFYSTARNKFSFVVVQRVLHNFLTGAFFSEKKRIFRQDKISEAVSAPATTVVVMFLYRTVVCMDKHLGTSPITSLQPSKLHLDIGYVPLTDTGSLCLAVDSTRTAVPGLFRLLVRRSLPDELRDPACDVDSFKQFFN